jgi:glycosyltransferase involved in cell wall biosynthesis
MTVRTVVAPPARLVARSLVRARTAAWPAYSRLFAVGDVVGWSTREDAEHLEQTAARLGYALGPTRWARFASRQSVFLSSHFDALSRRWLDSSHRLATAYLHGLPGTPGAPEFDDAFEALRRAPERLSRIQVTHAEMYGLVLSAGVPPDRVFRIPIGIDIEHFPLATAALRAAARAELDLPASAFVVGSFQKDGVGWGEGLEPKLVKGPDVFVAAVERLRSLAPELHVLLTGPARGYVRRELEHRGIPCRHRYTHTRPELARAYHALDVYLVSSRQEGGPKAVLESLATGAPLVTTRVGQVPEVVEPGRDALVVDVEDADALAAGAAAVRADESLRSALRDAGRATAERFAYRRLDPLWADLLDGFVARAG